MDKTKLKTRYIMKSNLIMLLLLIFSVSINAQVTEIPIENYWEGDNDNINNAYFKDINGLLNKYVGTWEYNQNGHYFKIKFVKQTNYQEVPLDSPYKIKRKSDRIYGLFEYKLNGVSIYNTILTQNKSYIYSDSGSFFMGNFLLFYDEPSTSPCGRPLMGRVTLGYSNTVGVETLTWSREDRYSGTFCQEVGQTEDSTPFKIPANMVLTKVP